MEFYKAIKYLLQGKNIRRASWGNGLYINQRGDLVYLFISGENGKRLLHTDERFSLNDVLAKDWEIFNETTE